LQCLSSRSGIDGKSECGKLDGNILRIITTPKIIDLRDEKSYEDKIKEILELVKPHSECWWTVMGNNYFKDPAKIERYRHGKFKKLYLEEKDL